MKRPVVVGARILSMLFTAGLVATIASAPVWAGPRSGGSFGGRGGFRSSGGSFGGSRSSSRGGGGGFLPLPIPFFGYGGYGGYGCGFGSLTGLVLVVGAVLAFRAMARRRAGGDPDEASDERAHVACLQVALERPAGVRLQKRLAELAESGETTSVEGLSRLLEATTLELTRDRDSIAQAALVVDGPIGLAAAERRFNVLAQAERARFQKERIRVVDGRTQRDAEQGQEAKEAMEYLVISVIVASRTRLGVTSARSASEVAQALGELGATGPLSLLATEVVWTPADSTDSLTTDDLLTLFPDLAPV